MAIGITIIGELNSETLNAIASMKQENLYGDLLEPLIFSVTCISPLVRVLGYDSDQGWYEVANDPMAKDATLQKLREVGFSEQLVKHIEIPFDNREEQPVM